MELLIAFAIFVIIMGIFIAFLFIGSYCASYAYDNDMQKICEAIEEARIKREEKIAAFWGTHIKSKNYNNPSNVTDDAFLLFIGEQKLAYGHPESIKSAGEEW